MELMKVAIFVPEMVFKEGEQLARQLGISRSQLYVDALSAYLRVRGTTAVTAKLNTVHARKTTRLDSALVGTQAARLAGGDW